MQKFTRWIQQSVRKMTLGVGIIAAAAGSAWAQSDTTEVRPSDLRPSSDSDSIAEQKEEVKASIELWEQRVHAKILQIDQILKGLDLKQIQAQKIAVTALMEILDDLDEEAQAIIAASNHVAPDLKLYREALERAPDLFRKIADTLEKRAGEKKSSFLKEAYADFASEARELANTYEAKAAGIGTLQADVAKKLEFVHESREFIADVHELLDAIPADHGLQTEQLITRINQYITVFQEAIDAIKGVAHKIGETPQLSPPNPEPTKPQPLPQATPRSQTQAAPLSLDEYRQRLTALRR